MEQRPLSADEKRLQTLRLFSLQEGIPFIPTTLSSQPPKKRKFSSLACRQKTNEITRKDPRNTEKQSLITNYFQRSIGSPTFDDKTLNHPPHPTTLRGFWNKYSAEIAKNLLLPVKSRYGILKRNRWDPS